MRGRPWYKRFPADFLAGTMALTLEEKGAFSVVLDMIYDRGGPIPDDPRYVARACGCSTRKWTSLRQRLIDAGKLTVRDGELSNPRAETMLASAGVEGRKLAQNAAKSHQARRENAAQSHDFNSLAGQGHWHRARDPEPETRYQIPETRRQTAAAGADPSGVVKTGFEDLGAGASRPSAGDPSDQLAVIGRQVLAAIGVLDDPRWLGSYGRVQRWLAEGFDPDLDILPTVERLMARRGQDPPRSLAYFDQAIADAKARRLKPMPEATADDRTDSVRSNPARNASSRAPSPHDRLLAGFAQAADRLSGEPGRDPLRRAPAAGVDPTDEN